MCERQLSSLILTALPEHVCAPNCTSPLSISASQRSTTSFSPRLLGCLVRDLNYGPWPVTFSPTRCDDMLRRSTCRQIVFFIQHLYISYIIIGTVIRNECKETSNNATEQTFQHSIQHIQLHYKTCKSISLCASSCSVYQALSALCAFSTNNLGLFHLGAPDTKTNHSLHSNTALMNTWRRSLRACCALNQHCHVSQTKMSFI